MEASPSATAMMAAVTRGRHRLEDSPPWVLDDPFALVIVGPEWRDIAATSKSLYPEEVGRQVRAGLVLRSRYAEERLTLGRFSQYVILGAGLDSFAWRRPDLVALRLLEVDHPASQEWKRQRVAELGLPISGEHVFASVDFEVQSLRDGLDSAGFDWTQLTLFSWLGVIPYLTIDAIEATLRTVAACQSGSEIAFEYGVTEPFLDDVGRMFIDTFSPRAITLGEPVRTLWSPADAEQCVVRCGLHIADHPSRDDLVSEYFANRTDGLQPWSVTRLMAASVA